MSDDPAPPDPARLAGLLADNDRRRVWAAVELGAGTLGEISAATGFDEPTAAKALARLRSAGLVTVTSTGKLGVDPAPLRAAARGSSDRARTGDEHGDQPDDVRKVLRSFVVDGRITALPTNRTKRRTVLDWLAQRFEPGRRYSEREVNELLDGHGVDRVTLRRYLVDEDFLGRESGEYWRSGGSVSPTRPGST
jgi:hypothetical protein